MGDSSGPKDSSTPEHEPFTRAERIEQLVNIDNVRFDQDMALSV